MSHELLRSSLAPWSRACALLRSARPAAAVTASPSWAALAPLASIHNTAPWEQPASSASWAGGWGRALGGVRSYQHVRPSDWARLLSEGKQRALREQSEAGGMEGAEGAGEEVADDQLEEYEDDETFRLTPPHMILTTDDDKQEYAAALANFSQVVTDEDRKKAATLASAKALADDSWNHVIGRIPDMPYEVPIKDVFAVVLIGGKQFKLTNGDFMYVDKIRGTKVGDKLLFPKVLLLGNVQETVVGRPWVPGASVIAAVEQQTRDAKQHVFKMKRRKGYRKFEGFRTALTQIRILEIVGIDEPSKK